MMSDSQNSNPAHSASAGKLRGPSSQAPDGHSVTKRLQTELMQLMMSNAPGISAFPESDANLLHWLGTVEGVEDTLYENLKYKVSIEFGQNYPYIAPVVKFVSPIWHPNIDMAGNICLDILKEKWSAVYNVQTILLSVQSLLGEPNNDSPLNGEAADLWKNPAETKRRVLQRYEEF